MTLQFWEAWVWPLKIALIGTWWQPLSLQNPGRPSIFTHTNRRKQHYQGKLYYIYECFVLTCFKYAWVKIRLSVRQEDTHTCAPSPTPSFMPVTENAAMWSSYKHDSPRLMKASHDTPSYESTQWRKDATPIRNLTHYFSCQITKEKVSL